VGSLITPAVLIHYEMLCRLSTLMPRKASRHRYHILAGVLGALCAHIIEIWLFAFGYYFMVNSGKFGTLRGNFDNMLLECGYFSFTAYSTLGLGDIEPVGNIRFLVGLEPLTGLVLITWTASFMFVEMQKFWNNKLIGGI
jgi:ion channel